MGEPSEFGRRLRAFRLRAGLSQNQLARLSGVPRPTISVVESGAQLNMNVENTFKLARALSVPVELLVHGDILEEGEPGDVPRRGGVDTGRGPGGPRAGLGISPRAYVMIQHYQ